jgi:hypothetical protein
MMCNLDDTYHEPCGHWGPRTVSSQCAAGLADPDSLKAGCWNSSVTGSRNVNIPCPPCVYRERVAGKVLGFGREEEGAGLAAAFSHAVEEPCSPSSPASATAPGTRGEGCWRNITRRGLDHRMPDPVSGQGLELGTWEGKRERAERKERERAVARGREERYKKEYEVVAAPRVDEEMQPVRERYDGDENQEVEDDRKRSFWERCCCTWYHW